eukprot:229220-Rhodomonas_salina.1
MPVPVFDVPVFGIPAAPAPLYAPATPAFGAPVFEPHPQRLQLLAGVSDYAHLDENGQPLDGMFTDLKDKVKRGAGKVMDKAKD